jgi:hypothetical protein
MKDWKISGPIIRVRKTSSLMKMNIDTLIPTE